MRGFSLAQGAIRPLGPAGKLCGLLGAWTFGRERRTLSWPRALGALTWLGRVEHEEEPHKYDQRQLVEQKRRHDGDVHAVGGAMRAFYRVFALRQLSAGLGYTT